MRAAWTSPEYEVDACAEQVDPPAPLEPGLDVGEKSERGRVDAGVIVLQLRRGVLRKVPAAADREGLLHDLRAQARIQPRIEGVGGIGKIRRQRRNGQPGIVEVVRIRAGIG